MRRKVSLGKEADHFCIDILVPNVFKANGVAQQKVALGKNGKPLAA